MTNARSGRTAIALGLLVGLLITIGIALGTDFKMSEPWAHRTRALVATAALAWSVLEYRRHRRGRALDPALVAAILAPIAVAAYNNFGNFGEHHFVHHHDIFHYYLGSKYAYELGYDGIYDAAVLAQQESGTDPVLASQRVRKLGDDKLGSASDAARRGVVVKARFTGKRWDDFVCDVGWFRDHTDDATWDAILMDYGYNPSPVYSASAHVFSSIFPATDFGIRALTLIDPALDVAALAAILWAFGWRAAFCGLILLTCAEPTSFKWLSGTFLRQDWLFALMLSVCCLRKGRPTIAGLAFSYACLVRIFPALLIPGLVAGPIWRRLRNKRPLPRASSMFSLGLVAGALLFLPAGAAVAGTGSYATFAAHLSLHETATAGNTMGLKALLEYRLATRQEHTLIAGAPDPFVAWDEGRQRALKERMPIYVALACAATILVMLAAMRVGPWQALALSPLLVVTVPHVACYYMSIALLLAPLVRHRPRVERGVLLLATLSAWFAVMPAFSMYFDDRYASQSVIYLVAITAVTLLHVRSARRRKSSANSPGSGRQLAHSGRLCRP